jgi:uncharacterized membrane protein YeaQ/YmgE (transglycosylase-associated protein family)
MTPAALIRSTATAIATLTVALGAAIATAGTPSDLLGQIVTSTIGAVVVLLVVGLIKKA